jgi:sialic acid synthase SpsE
MLIAEIGNNHFGDFSKAKELIHAAHESGADIIKSQAFLAKDIGGSMPVVFYQQCAFSLRQYKDLIEYARSIGNDLFYSIFSPELDELRAKQNWHKLASSQVQKSGGQISLFLDHENVIISVPKDVTIPMLRNAELLHPSKYMVVDPDLGRIRRLSHITGRNIGYSDHTLGIRNCIRASELYGARIIEKHFCLSHGEQWRGITFRDTVHGATPKEFQTLTMELCDG